MMSSVSKARWAVKVASAGAIMCLAGQAAYGAAVVRHFPGDIGLAVNPDDPEGDLIDPVAGAGVAFLFNANSDDPTYDLESPIGAEPTFVEGRFGGGDLAVHFDGHLQDPESDPASDNQVTNLFTGPGGQWRTYGNYAQDVMDVLSEASGGQFTSTFNTGYQLWAKPDEAGLGQAQTIAINGGGQWGGAGITAEGNWAHIWSRNGGVQFTDTGIPVAFGEWTNLGAINTGNLNRLFVNGAAANQGFGWYGGSGAPTTFGSRHDGFSQPYIGALDDLKFMVTSVIVGGFTPAFDLDIFADTPFSGITGDIDQDGLVTSADYDIWAANAGFDNGQGFGDPSTLLLGDANQNGLVDFADLTIIKAAAAAAGTPIPEPASLALLAMGGLAMARRRNRA